MKDLLFNTAVISNQTSLLGNVANVCLASLRFLFHGRTVEIWNKIVIHEEESYTVRHWTQTAAAVLLLVPGIILGIVARILDYACFKTTRADFAAIEAYDQHLDFFEEETALDVSHACLDKMATAIKDRMTSKMVWKDPLFISDVTSFMEAAYQEMEMFFEEIAGKNENDPARMARAMAQEGPNNGDPLSIYFPFYFYSSLTEMYHFARSYAYLEDLPSGRGGRMVHFAVLTEEDQNPYFTVGTPQYHWRELYNNFCNKLNEIEGLREHLKKEDQRFLNWAQPDDEFVEKYGFPDTRPTPLYFPDQ